MTGLTVFFVQLSILDISMFQKVLPPVVEKETFFIVLKVLFMLICITV